MAANFDEALSKAKDMAEVIGKKSAEALELSRLKLNEAEAKNKLSKAYAELGRVYYDVLNGKPENAQRKSIALSDINLQKKRLKMIQTEIRAMQTAE